MATHIDRPSSNSTSDSPRSPVMARFWRAMQHLFGLRWSQNYGQEPSPLWAAEIDRLTDAQIATAYRRLLQSGAAHPPTLPEFLELARKPAAVTDTYVAPHNCAQFELAANNWFLSRAVQGRFNGIDGQSMTLMRERALQISKMHTDIAADGDPEATNARLVQQLDAAAESFYPTSVAEIWNSAVEPTDPKYFA